MDGVKVGLALAAPLDADQADPIQFRGQLGNAHPAHAHVLGQTVLAGKARIIVPGVAQEHSISHLGSHREVRVFEDKIWHLREAAPNDQVVGVQLQVLLLDDFPNLFHL